MIFKICTSIHFYDYCEINKKIVRMNFFKLTYLQYFCLGKKDIHVYYLRYIIIECYFKWHLKRNKTEFMYYTIYLYGYIMYSILYESYTIIQTLCYMKITYHIGLIYHLMTVTTNKFDPNLYLTMVFLKSNC